MNRLHVNISKLKKECMITYLSPNKCVPEDLVKNTKSFTKFQGHVPRVCNTLLESIENCLELPGSPIHFLKVEASPVGDGLFKRNVL